MSTLFAAAAGGGLTLITTAKLNDVDPQAWLADVLARLAALPMSRLAELLPWAWRPAASSIAA
jgi:transposase